MLLDSSGPPSNASDAVVGKMLGQTPGMKPPLGVVPNFVNPESLRAYWILMMCACLTFSTVFVAMRLYTKLILTKLHGWEDYTSYAAWLGLIGYLAIDFVAFSHGAGVHQWNLPLEDVVVFAKTVNAKEVGYAPVMFFAKLSILLQFLRIFVPRRNGAAFYCIHIVIWLNFFYYFAYFFVTIFICTPRRKIWDPQTPGHCLNTASIVISAALINVISDFWMLLIPLFCISTLQMPLAQKFGIGAVFATGFFACITSIMRTVASFHVVGAIDLTWDLIPLAFWADAEITSGVVVGCLPVLPAFFRHFVPKIKSHFSSYRRSKNQSTSHSGPSIARPHSPVASWDDSYRDSHGLTNSYLELDDKSLGPTPKAIREEILIRSMEFPNGSLVRGIQRSDLESGSSNPSVVYPR